MKKLFRLKREAVPFFKDIYTTDVGSWETWMARGISENALEELPKVYMSYGHKDGNHTSLCSHEWKDSSAKFKFELNITDVSADLYGELKSEKNIAEMIAHMENVCSLLVRNVEDHLLLDKMASTPFQQIQAVPYHNEEQS